MLGTESQIEKDLIKKLEELKYTYRSDIRDRATLEANFRQKFETLNRVNLTDAEFARLRDEIVTPDVYLAAKNSAKPIIFSVKMAPHYITLESTPKTGVKMTLKSSTNSVSTQKTVIIAMM